MRETRQSGSEGGETEPNRSSLPLSLFGAWSFDLHVLVGQVLPSPRPGWATVVRTPFGGHASHFRGRSHTV